jgi:lipoprotein-anchoring transpeptidase ErfK/SrfK
MWYGAPSALPVLAQDNGYLEVRLAQRPNGSTAWIASSAVTLSSTPYRIVVDLATEHLKLYKAGHLLMSAPAGIGTVQDPTPTGNFFVVLFAAPSSAAWGPFVMVTSGHSNAISDYEESGDAIVAIHGPLGADAAIGTTGARISHGCVRLHDVDLDQLRAVAVGSPVQIIS